MLRLGNLRPRFGGAFFCRLAGLHQCHAAMGHHTWVASRMLEPTTRKADAFRHIVLSEPRPAHRDAMFECPGWRATESSDFRLDGGRLTQQIIGNGIAFDRLVDDRGKRAQVRS
ncbi:hypothetical protein [Rhizobium binae]|uniref:hypothetical protein n=1 Tax=Rhizobium binae TaxID=1138190 RepID=UPI001C83DD1D|nr:hypothetical protein [Rhizobium binae]